MTSAGQRLFLVSLTLGAFVIGTTMGSVLTFGPGPEAKLVAGDTGLAERAKLAVAASVKGDAGEPMSALAASSPTEKDTIQSRLGHRRLTLADGRMDIAPAAGVSALHDLQADGRANSGLPAAITPPDPALTSESEVAAIARIAKAALTPRPWKTQKVKVRKGDSLTTILKRAGIEGRQVHTALRSLRGVYDPRGLRSGQELAVTAATREGQPAQLLSVALDLDFDHQLLITRDAGGVFTTKKVEQAQRRALMHRAGDIQDSLYLSARRASVPNSVTDQLIRLFSWDVDFQRDIRRGDHFETLYEEVTLEKDESQVKGDLVYAGLTLRGKVIDAYLYAPDGGLRTYYDSEGRSLRKFLLRTPIDGARLSSGFGMRKHPVLGYSRMHKGTDFAAPRGTPIYAGGSGKVEVAGRKGGYGNYIRIRHSNTYSTAYAHMHKFAKGMKPGVRVRQGQVIGYVGTTGRSTGNHLHYEVLKKGKQVNPLKMKQPPATKLTGADFAAFKKEVARIDAKREQLVREQHLVSQAVDNAKQ